MILYHGTNSDFSQSVRHLYLSAGEVFCNSGLKNVGVKSQAH